jgi:gliding motility-associated protein GldE
LDTDISEFYTNSLLLNIVFTTEGLAVAGLLIALLLFCSSLLSASEVAFFSLSPTDLNRLRQQETSSVGIQRILRLIDMPRTLLATILIANNFVNIALVIVSDLVLKNIFGETIFLSWAQKILNTTGVQFTIEQIAGVINFLITVVGVTFLLVLFGEIMPKIYAKANNLSLARFMAGPILFLSRMFRPINYFLVNWSNKLEHRFDANNNSVTSKEDIDKAIELTVTGVGAQRGVDMLKNIVTFGDVPVKQIMCSRVKMIGIESSVLFLDVMKVAREAGFSRYPIYDEDLDNIIGILYAKDLLEHLDKKDDFDWKTLLRGDVLYVPESKKIDDLLRQFQRERRHVAIVVDEYGGTSGMVTLEDIIEEVIGEIKDEFDDETEIEFKKIDNFTYIFEGKTLLNDVCRVLKIETTFFEKIRGDADSIAGLMLEIIGYFPKKEAEITFRDYKFQVVAINKRRIEQVKVTLPKV